MQILAAPFYPPRGGHERLAKVTPERQSPKRRWIRSSTGRTSGTEHAIQRARPGGSGANTSGGLQVLIAISGSGCFTIGQFDTRP